MPRIAGGLLPGETVVLAGRRHWLVPVRESLLAAGLVVAGLVLWAITPVGEGALGVLTTLLGLLRWGLLLAGLGWIAWNLLLWRTAVYVVTTRRLVRAEGILGRRQSETMLAAVSDARLHVSFLGARLGYGDVQVFTASGAAGAEVLTMLATPSLFRNALLEAKIEEAADARSALAASVPAWSAGAPGAAAAARPAPVAGPPPAAVAAPRPAPVAGRPPANDSELIVARLVKLAELRDRGIISDADFEAKKAELLARL